jgi:hypothetical protein
VNVDSGLILPHESHEYHTIGTFSSTCRSRPCSAVRFDHRDVVLVRGRRSGVTEPDAEHVTESWPRVKRHTPGRWTFLAALLVVFLACALACAVTVAIFTT